MAFIGAVYLLIAGLLLAISQTTVTATRQANAEKYKALTYKLESEACRDQFGLLNKEIIDEVQRWNVKVTYYKAMEDNFWVGIYYPDVYGDLGTIDYETYEGGQNHEKNQNTTGDNYLYLHYHRANRLCSE